MRHCAAVLAPKPEQKHRANDRHDEPGGMKGGTGSRLGEHSSNQATYDGSRNAEHRGPDKPELLYARENCARTQADDETDNNRPEDV